MKDQTLVTKKLAAVFASALFLVPCYSAGFGGSVVEYTSGAGFNAGYTNAAAALGEPSRMTPGQFGGPVDVFDPPYLASQLVSLGAGGSLTLRFEAPVTNSPDAPFGLDFIVFENSGFVITNNDFSGGGISDGTTFGPNTADMRVSVSADGTNFFELVVPSIAAAGFAPGLLANRAFPTDGSGDFHTPLDPALTLQSFAGKSLGEIRALYGGSAGGTAFDIGWARDAEGGSVQLQAIQFVRIEALANSVEIDGVASVTPASQRPGIPAKSLVRAFDQWSAFGDTNLFNVQSNAVAVTWDSSQTNSYFYLPLGLTLTRADHFRLSFTLQLSSATLGTTPGKPYTFEIATGLLNLSNAFNPLFYRGTGIDAEHGPRNLLELDYFPDSGFGATVAPAIATEANQILFSDNHPIELEAGTEYRFQMEFTPEDGTLRAYMVPQRIGGPIADPLPLNSLVMSDSLADFHLNALAIASYSDAGQEPQFAGSVTARGLLYNFGLMVFERPKMELTQSGGGLLLSFESSSGRNYFVETSSDALTWSTLRGPLPGTGNPITTPIPAAAASGLFRVRAESR